MRQREREQRLVFFPFIFWSTGNQEKNSLLFSLLSLRLTMNRAVSGASASWSVSDIELGRRRNVASSHRASSFSGGIDHRRRRLANASFASASAASSTDAAPRGFGPRTWAEPVSGKSCRIRGIRMRERRPGRKNKAHPGLTRRDAQGGGSGDRVCLLSRRRRRQRRRQGQRLRVGVGTAAADAAAEEHCTSHDQLTWGRGILERKGERAHARWGG